MEILGLDHAQNVLVIEDKLSFALRLVEWLEAKGHTVYAYDGVLSVENNVLLGTKSLTEATPSDVDLTKIQYCFLDHYFEGDAYNGTSLTRILALLGIKVCGMSSVDDANFSMRRSGAVCAYRKDVLGRNLGF